MTDPPGAGRRGPRQPVRHRYEAWVDGALAGFSEYEPHQTWLVFTHTEVFAAFEGKGVGCRSSRRARSTTSGRVA